MPVCSTAQPGSLPATLSVRPRVSVESSHSHATSARSEKAEERCVRSSRCRATTPRFLPMQPFPPGYCHTDFLSAQISLKVLRIPTVPGISFIVSRIWVAALFFPYIPLCEFQSTLWLLMNLFLQPPQKQASSVLQIKEPITDTKGSQLTGLPHTEGRSCSHLASAFDLLCGLCFLTQ